MALVIAHAELVSDQTSDPRTAPQRRREAVRLGAFQQQRLEAFELRGVQQRLTAGAAGLAQPGFAVTPVSSQPLADALPRDLQSPRCLGLTTALLDQPDRFETALLQGLEIPPYAFCISHTYKDVRTPKRCHFILRDSIGGYVVFLTLCSAPLVAQDPNWTLKVPTDAPTPRTFHAMAYDAARAQVVLFGGLDGQILQDEHPLENRDDTWVWDGTNWTQKSPANSPPPRGYLAMAYDAARAQVVLFGGINSNNFVRYNDTWVWPSDSGGGGTIVVLPLSLSFTYQEGDFGPIVPQPLAVSGTGGPIGFTTFASTTSGGNWLSVTPTNDTTPSTLSVSVAPGLLAGTYNGEITILSGVASNSPQHVDVTLTSLDKKDVFLTAPVKKPDPTREYAFNLGDVSERCIANSVDYFHTGIDYVNKNILKDKKKLPDVLAAAAGRVIIPKEGGSACDGPVPESGFKNHGLGNVVILEHSTGDGVLYTLYGHLSKITVASGKEVKQGEKIGEMGNTCTSDIHLHFELKSEGVPEKPDDAPCGIGTCYPAAGQSCWGYTLGWPDAFGYSDPAPFIK